VTGSLRRTLSLWQVSLSGIGVILGAGVYALIGPAAGHAGKATWAVRASTTPAAAGFGRLP
jgi:APA family basic amino acid/polyamine antiporter